jgi:glutamine synthetase
MGQTARDLAASARAAILPVGAAEQHGPHTGSGPLVEKTLGKELRDEFVKYKTIEGEGFRLTVSQWEVER